VFKRAFSYEHENQYYTRKPMTAARPYVLFRSVLHVVY
jgi:hypothetical protein